MIVDISFSRLTLFVHKYFLTQAISSELIESLNLSFLKATCTIKNERIPYNKTTLTIKQPSTFDC